MQPKRPRWLAAIFMLLTAAMALVLCFEIRGVIERIANLIAR